MTRRGRRYLAMPVAGMVAAGALCGCTGPWGDETGRSTAPTGDAPVMANDTPYSDALRCLKQFTTTHPLRVAVGQIADYTDKRESDNSGRTLTQGAALMAMSALAKAGVPLVERFDSSIAEMELEYANVKLITDRKQGGEYRRILAGSIPGSDYYLIGGITELNFDGDGMSSNSVKGTADANLYVMNVGLDLRLVDTNSLEVVDVISDQKQIIGRQEQAGLFDFMGHTFDASLDESEREPIQFAVRSVIERAVLEMMSRLYRTAPNACTSQLYGAADPLAGPGDPPLGAAAAKVSAQPHLTGRRWTAGRASASRSTVASKEKYNRKTRNGPHRRYSSNAAGSRPSLRGRVE